jgi:hypothetical protein
MPARPATSPLRRTAIEFEHDLVVRFRVEAARREMTVPQLIRDLLDVIAADGLTTAILDDGTEQPRQRSDRHHNLPDSISRSGR